jgi:hypothetical protein
MAWTILQRRAQPIEIVFAGDMSAAGTRVVVMSFRAGICLGKFDFGIAG